MKSEQKKIKKKLKRIYNILYGFFGPQYWWPGDTSFEIAIGAILTQNTNWGNVEKAMSNLKKERVLNADILHKMSHQKLASLIRPAGYFNVKAERLKNFIGFLMNNYTGSMERMKAEDTYSLSKGLLGVNGIGPETADSILLYALERPVFVIDAYTKRIFQRHGITSDKVTYHELQDVFQRNLPSEVSLFNEYHALLVMLGKHYCRPKPRCEECPLEEISIMPGRAGPDNIS